MAISQQKYKVVHDLMLHEAACMGDDLKLSLHITYAKRGKFNINFKDEDFASKTALHCAAENGHLRCCKSLLEGGADPSLRMCMGWTPVHCAAEGGYLSVLQLLAETGASLTARDDYGDTPKAIARRYAHEDCVAYLENIENSAAQRKTILKDVFKYAAYKNLEVHRATAEEKEEQADRSS
eukprot:gene4735-5358_t